jgi:hypothetical protein
MNYYISEEVPEVWDNIVSAFITMVEYDVEFNKGVPIEKLEFRVKRGLLAVTYNGGSKITDAFAMFAKEMSSGICGECGLPATRAVYQNPRCDQCD